MAKSLNYFFVEGKCEKNLIERLELIGQIKLWDLVELEQHKLLRLIGTLSSNKKSSNIFVVFDTDLIENNQHLCKRFSENIKFLKKHGFSVHLLQQQRDFESMLCFELSISMTQLQQHFNARNKDDFKTNFCQEKNLDSKLQSIKTSFNLWSKPLISQLSFLEPKYCEIKTYHILKPKSPPNL